jgi:23S rRNA (guanosine2251-2'-O)-methyltransferase
VESVVMAAGRDPAPVLEEILQTARSNNIPVQRVSIEELRRVVRAENLQGIAARVRAPTILPLERLLEEQTGVPHLLLLDQIQDPHNVGALLRSASAAGATGVILTGRRSAPLTGTVAKTSAGAVHHLRLSEVTNLARAMDAIREAGIWITGLDADAPRLLYDVDLTGPVALVVGGEASGLRRLTRDRCDFLVRLPMIGPTESLNASVAGSLALYEVVRQRLAAGLIVPAVG